MYIEVLKSKLHRVKVTHTNLNYIGSITIDEDLMDAANLIAGEKVQIMDNDNGERFETYVIKGERGSGCICLNGAAARRVVVGDTIIIVSYALMDFEEAKTFQPSVVFPREQPPLTPRRTFLRPWRPPATVSLSLITVLVPARPCPDPNPVDNQ